MVNRSYLSMSGMYDFGVTSVYPKRIHIKLYFMVSKHYFYGVLKNTSFMNKYHTLIM